MVDHARDQPHPLSNDVQLHYPSENAWQNKKYSECSRQMDNTTFYAPLFAKTNIAAVDAGLVV